MRHIALQSLMLKISEWSNATFGDGQRTIPILHHLKKEVPELIHALEKLDEVFSNTDEIGAISRQEVNVKYEFADCLMLLLDAAHQHEITAEELFEYTNKKIEINKRRKWGEPDENGVVEHIKE